ncbi:hypothetical protein BDV98DRAFT_600625 [Pterulicium gracile]|uniref:LysM domain-containing protein n=1 Tax=Pterulicium gracile TaxID=1884261 RepID=A0A5C3QZ38_9AGAR|nr:hypothetical protein BDV98DRAFT_600625 [Pterula gracilis]
MQDDDTLPDGMRLTGYDADEQMYYFTDDDGAVYCSPTSRGNGLVRVAHGQQEPSNTRSDGYQSLSTDSTNPALNHSAASRQLYPFYLLIAVVLLLCWKYVLSPGLRQSEPLCDPASHAHLVQPGDSCWAISEKHGISLDDLKGNNPTLNCDTLMPGNTICILGMPPVNHVPSP